MSPMEALAVSDDDPPALDRAAEFDRVIARLRRHAATRTRNGFVAGGNSLELLRLLPGSSFSLILVDPPYHSTKKANVMGDRDFSGDADFLAWMEAYASEWQRLLRPSGSAYVFCSAEMSAKLEVTLGQHLQPLSHITWTKPNEPGFDGWKGKMQKEALRRWYPHSERILFFGKAAPGHVRRSPLGEYLKDARQRAGLSAHQLTSLIGAYGKVNHGGAVSNWETGRNVPSREQYSRIVEALEATGNVRDLLSYEDLVRPFQVSRDVQFTDVWDFPSVRVYRGKHPAEKPLDLLTNVILASSYEGDLVLDCFCGSGSTLEAAVKVKRRVVGIELDERWIQRSADRLSLADSEEGVAAIQQFGRPTRVNGEEPAGLF